MNIVFPMAGRGERFAKKGFNAPKPMIEVMRKPIVQHVLDHYPLDARYIFIILREHREKGLEHLLLKLRPQATIITIDEVTEGPVCTVLKARAEINTDEELLIADCDSVLIWPDRWVFEWFKSRSATGGVTTRVTNNPACSYAAIDTDGWVIETREKDPFTMFSTTGPYWWRHGLDFIEASERMMKDDRRTNGEFYVSPVYNYHISSGGRVLAYPLPEFWSLGTPEDVDRFLSHSRLALASQPVPTSR